MQRFRTKDAPTRVLTDLDSELPPMVLADDGAEEAERCPKQVIAHAE